MAKKQIYIFYYKWKNTAGNHAGMAYFAQRLKRELGSKIVLLATPRNYGCWRHGIRKLWRKLIVSYLTFTIAEEDVLFFMEYLGGRRPGDHREYALELRKIGVHNRLIGLVHLPMSALRELYDVEYINKSLDPLDEIVVLGSSLAGDLIHLGYDRKVRQTFHYVDTKYYCPRTNKHRSLDTFHIISMGFLYRDHNIMEEIVSRCPNMTFHLFLGDNMLLQSTFAKYENAKCYKFMSEDDLLNKMQEADVSISVFNDTVGSNVITTSLACGLPQIVSDVGSIRDYCSEESAVFCNRVDDYVNGLKKLKCNKELCLQMSRSARKRAEQISLYKSIDWYRDLLFEKER